MRPDIRALVLEVRLLRATAQTEPILEGLMQSGP